MPGSASGSPRTIVFLLTKRSHALAELGLDSLAVNIRVQRPAEADASRPGPDRHARALPQDHSGKLVILLVFNKITSAKASQLRCQKAPGKGPAARRNGKYDVLPWE